MMSQPNDDEKVNGLQANGKCFPSAIFPVQMVATDI
jgi:hypothetical protein